MITTGTEVRVKALAFVAMCLLLATSRLPAASVDSTGRLWTESPDYTSVNLVPSDTAATISVISMAEWADPRRERIDPRSATVLVDSGVQSSPFVGNYLNANVRGFSFQLASTCGQADMCQPDTYTFLRASSGREWRCSITVAAGQTTRNRLPLDYTAWRFSNSRVQKPPYTAWVADISSIVEVGVRVTPWGTGESAKAQTYTVSEFYLVGDNGVIGPAATLTAGQRKGLLNRFGVLQFENVASDRGVDTDGDGLADYYEIMVGTDWNKDDDKFASKIAASASGVVLRWRCNAGVYNVLRADGDINNGFRPVAMDGVEDLESSAAEESAGYMERVDGGATGNGPYFYRVERVRNK